MFDELLWDGVVEAASARSPITSQLPVISTLSLGTTKAGVFGSPRVVELWGASASRTALRRRSRR